MKDIAAMSERIVRWTVKSKLREARKDPAATIQQVLPWVSYFLRNETHRKQAEHFRRAVDSKDNYYELTISMLRNLDPNCLEKLAENIVLNAAWTGNQRVRKNRNRYDLNIPWAILIDPTSACNLRCSGCWAEGYGRNDDLEIELIDRIIREGKELGIYVYLYSGGEPLIRRNDLIALAKKHDDCYFLAFSNGTLVNGEFVDEMAEAGNMTIAFSIEGSRAETDERRGTGSYRRMIHAMELMKERGVPFGFSTCYHAGNWETVGSDEYIDRMIELGAIFGWYFTYIPVGRDAVPELMAKPEHREYMYHRVREARGNKPIFLLDFWNDGEYVYGCIAGGRNYFHINARGDVEPCAFIHYSDTNIRDVSLLEALRPPLFDEYRKRQPFNRNPLRPCPLLDNPATLRSMVHASRAYSTEYRSPESVDTLTAKTVPAANAWEPVAQALWEANPRRAEIEHREWPGKPAPKSARKEHAQYRSLAHDTRRR